MSGSIQTYAFIDADSGLLWGVQEGVNIYEAVEAMERGIDPAQSDGTVYERVSQLNGASGYEVYEVPVDYVAESAEWSADDTKHAIAMCDDDSPEYIATRRVNG